MKKILGIALAGMMVLGFTGSALAAEPTEAAKIKVKDLPGYQQLVTLRSEGKAIREQIKNERQQIKTLIQQAKQDKNKEVLQNVKALRPDVKQLRDELMQLRETQKANHVTLKEARQANDHARVENILNQIVSTRQEINAKLTQIKSEADQLLLALQ